MSLGDIADKMFEDKVTVDQMTRCQINCWRDKADLQMDFVN